MKLPDGLVPGSAAWQLYDELHNLHELAGLPSCKEVGKVLDVSKTSVYNVFRGIPSLLPKRPILLDIVEVLARRARREDVDDERKRFDGLWEALRREIRE